MDYIKTTQKIKDNKVIVDIPEDFKSKNVEIIILPIFDEDNLNEAIMRVSEKSFQKWDNKEDEIYNTL